MFESELSGQQYIAGLNTQLAILKSQFNRLESIPTFVRERKGMEVQYQALKMQISQLENKIKIAQTKYAEMIAGEEAEGFEKRLGDKMSKNIKIVAIGSGILLLAFITGIIIYKRKKK